MVVAAVVEIGEKLDDEEEVEEEEMLGVGVAMEVEGLVYDVERAWVYGCEGGSLMRERWQQQRATKQLMLFLISLVNVSIDLDRQLPISMYVCIHSRFINVKVISSMREVLR